jgi:hypothetical protein
MKKSFLTWHVQNGGDVSTIDGNGQDDPKETRKANPELKQYNYKFINQIEVIDAEVLKKC